MARRSLLNFFEVEKGSCNRTLAAHPLRAGRFSVHRLDPGVVAPAPKAKEKRRQHYQQKYLHQFDCAIRRVQAREMPPLWGLGQRGQKFNKATQTDNTRGPLQVNEKDQQYQQRAQSQEQAIVLVEEQHRSERDAERELRELP